MSRDFSPVPQPRAPVYLFYGNQVDNILSARDQLLNDLLDPETRNESLTEYMPEGNTFGVELMKLLPEIAGDLDTHSFLADSRKVAVVMNPKELYGSASSRGRAPKKGGTRKKAAPKPAAEDDDAEDAGPSDALRWIAEVLPKTGNHLVLLAFEDESEGREVNDKLPLFQLIAKLGPTRGFRDKKSFFQLEDSLLARDANRCLHAVRELWGSGKGDNAVYGGIVRTMRFMLQTNIAAERRIGGDPAKLEVFFPARSQFNLFKASDWTRKKYRPGQIPYRTASLLIAYERMLGVYRAMRPSREELYVPDALALLEQVLMELFASPAPAIRR